jgi:hypothetical protein
MVRRHKRVDKRTYLLVHDPGRVASNSRFALGQPTLANAVTVRGRTGAYVATSTADAGRVLSKRHLGDEMRAGPLLHRRPIRTQRFIVAVP